MDYHYNFGLSQNFLGESYGRGDIDGMKGHSLHFAARYDITERVSAGGGIGLDVYDNLSYGTLPVFATCRYEPINGKRFYAFTNLGYSICGGEDFSRGMMFDIGVGYPIMLSKYFGINIQLGYNLSHFSDVDFDVVSVAGNCMTVYTEKVNGNRHSLSLGVGITF